MIEEIIGNIFYLSPHYQNSPAEAPPQNKVVRYTPYEHATKPIQYARSLLCGRIARSQQICGNNRLEIVRSILEVCTELHDPPNLFPWKTLTRATHGIRNAEALPHVRTVRNMSVKNVRNMSQKRVRNMSLKDATNDRKK